VSRIVLRNATLELAFDAARAALVGLKSRATGWQVLYRPELGLSFELLVPTRAGSDGHATGRRHNRVFGRQQPAARPSSLGTA
jgi:hypothetical protein